jgi:hypothetical protein
MLSRDLMQPGTWVPILKAGTTLTPELIAKLRRMGLERVALGCIEAPLRKQSGWDFPLFLTQDEVEQITAVLAGRGDQGDLRQVVYSAVRRLNDSRAPVDFRIPGPFEQNHMLNVFQLSLVIGHALDYGPTQLVSLATGALLHDVGKALLPGRLIGKAGQLTLQEREMLRHHPQLGVALLTKSPRFGRWLVSRDAIEIVRHHHERFDGTGYPDRLRGANIPRMASIVAVADVFDAMVSDKPYARRTPAGVAHQTIRSMGGRQLDPVVVEAFLRRVLPYPSGAEVILSDRRVARVLRATSDMPLRPLVGIDGEEIDLDRERRLDIVGLKIPRRADRTDVAVPVRIGLGEGHAVWGKSVNLSPEGACIDLVGDRHSLGADVEIQFCDSGAMSAPVKAKVCWSRKGGDGTVRIGIHARGAELLTRAAVSTRRAG